MNYYNEFDPKAAAWLRELIAEDMIPAGEVDERSITDVRADELLGYTQCHFFAGIGGWSLALRLIGWPDDRPVWTGSCPCQAFSTAGKQRGFDDERDLWPVFANLIAECRPEFVFGEQVENAIRHGWLDRVYADLEREGYAVGAHVLGAHSVGSPHRRQRLYWGAASVAENADGRRCGGRDDGDQAGRGREVQAPRLGGDGGMADGNCQQCKREISTETGRNDCFKTERSVRVGGMAELQGDGRRQGNPDAGSGAECTGAFRGFADNSDVCELADNNGKRQQEQCGDIAVEQNEQREATPIGAELRSLSNLPWLNSRFVYCRDGKVRRIPAESLLFGLADGVSEGMDGSGVVGVSEDGGFPLTTQKEGRVMLLKGYGNAIVPQVAAAFVAAFCEANNEVNHE